MTNVSGGKITVNDIRIENNLISGLDPPVASSDATNKAYVDTAVQRSYFYSYGPTAANVLTITNTPQLLELEEKISSGTGDYTIAVGVVTMVKAGVYRTSYWAQFSSNGSSGSARASFQVSVYIDSTLLAGSEASCYMREQSSSAIQPGCGKTILVNASAGQTIDIRIQRISASSTGQTVENRSVLTIERISS